MARIHFYLKDKQAKQTSIQAHISGNSQKKKVGLGLSIDVVKWNFKTERLNKGRILTISEQKDNEFLDEIENLFLEYKGESVTEIADRLKQYIATGSLGEVETLAQGFDLITNSIPDERKSTRDAYIATKNAILKYKDVPLSKVNLPYIEGLSNYFRKKGGSKNTIGKHIKQIKAVMGKTLERELHNNLKYKTFEIEKEKVESIALTQEEVDKLRDLNLGGRDELIRDLFLMAVYTGLRFSDFSQIKLDAIDDGILVIPKTQKTGVGVEIPLKADALRILNKYGTLPPVPSNQAFNSRIKKIAKAAKFEGKVLISKTIGGVRTTKTYNRYEVISAHTARRTMATLAYKMGSSSLGIMSVTGHTTEKSFLNYIKVTKREQAKLLSRDKFFQ